MNKRQLFDSDSQVSQDDIQSNNTSPQRKRNQPDDLYKQNFHKYVTSLKQLSQKIQFFQQKALGDGIWYVNHPLINITQINYEKNLGIFDIVNMQQSSSQSAIYKKLLVIFTFLDNQVQKIIQVFELNLYDNLLMYGQQISDKQNKQSPQIMTSKILIIYKKIYDLVKKLMAYIQNLILQLHSIINKKSTHYKAHKSMNFDPIIDLIGKCLRSIYIIDCIVQNNINIDQHWQKYQKMIKLIKNQPDKFNTTSIIIKKLEKQSHKLQKTILSKQCMKTISQIQFDQIFEKTSNPLGRIKNNKDFRQYFQGYFERKIKQIQQNLGSTLQNDQQKKILDLMCNYNLYRKLFPGEQARDVWKNIWGIQKKIPIIQAHSFVCVYICVFMQQVVPLSKKSRSMDPPNQSIFIKTYLNKLEQVLGLQIVSYYTKFCVWLSRMQSVATSNSSLRGINDNRQKDMKILQQRLSNRIILLIQGFNLILKLNKLLYLCLILHATQGKNIKLQLLGKIILGLQTVKAASYIIRKKVQAFDTMIITRTLTKDLVNVIQPVYNRLYKQQSARKQKQNIQKLQIFKIILNLLKGPISQLKITLIKYGYNFIKNWVFKDQQKQYITKCLNKIQIIFYNQILIRKYQNCSYLYYCKDILPQIFKYKRQNPNTCKRLQFLFECFQDPAYMIQKCIHLNNENQIFLQFKKYLISNFQQHYMLPLKRKIEDFLRITTHSMLIQKIEGIKPFEQQIIDIIKLVQLQKIRIFDSVVDLKFEISNSFNTSFYNLNIINMHDMQTYEQMKIMGNHIFNLKLHDTYLPSHTIQQNKFDILKIIKNIPQFIATYKYNLLTQKFLQITNQNKIITSVGVQQLSDSIKTHGLGILSTSINSIYKYLVGKVQAFSKFLYTQNIKNLLTKQKKYFKDLTQSNDYIGYYPYQRAQHLYKEIKKLGKFQDQTNYLDKFRDIISSVGNALGFIRLLRSASLNSSSKTIQYLPNKIEIGQTFQQLSNKAQMSDATKLCCKQLDDILKSLQQKFGNKIDYLNLMIKACSKISQKQNKHLKLYYLIIPALSINYVEFMAKGKQQIDKKISSKAFLYDDGFTLGVSFFINLLKQHQYVKIMHWDQSTTAYFQSAKNYSKQLTDPSQHSAKFIQDLNMQQLLLVKKLQSMNHQFMLFYYNLQSSNVLFKGSLQQEKKNLPTSPPSTANSVPSENP